MYTQTRLFFTFIFATQLLTPIFAEIHFQLNFTQSDSDYVVYTELSATDLEPGTTHRAESPDGRIWCDTDGNDNASFLIWTNSFDGLLQDVTNGLWSLILNYGETTAETNGFSLSADGFDASLFGNPTILYPAYDSIITNQQPTFLWDGPSQLPELYVQVTDEEYTFFENSRLDSSTTSWVVPSLLPVGACTVFISYEDMDFGGLSCSNPTNAAGTALSGWTHTFDIASYTWSDFSVTSASAPSSTSLGSALEAYYLPWTTGGNADWFSQTVETYDGIDSAQSGSIGFMESSWIETTVTNEGILQGWMHIDADENDYVELEINGISEDSWWGPTDWEPYDYFLDTGDTIRWTFYNEDNTGAGQDAVFLDMVGFGEADSLGLAVDAPQFEWTTGGEDDWYPQLYGSSPNDIDNAECGYVSPEGESWIETTIEGPGSLNFIWINQANEGEVLTLELNGTELDRLESGQFSWESYSLDLPTGTHSLRWTFVNDNTEMSGPAGLDQVFYTPADAEEQSYEAEMNFRINRTVSGTNASYFAVYPYFSDFAPTSSTIEVESYNGFCKGGDYVSTYHAFNTLQDAIDECHAGPWTIYFDRNTANEKVFTFNVSVLLPPDDLPPVVITSPVQDATGVSVNPDYTWTGPTNYSSIRANIYDEENETYIDHSPSLSATATAWTNALAATAGTNRFTVTYTWNLYPGIYITEPQDDSSRPLDAWNEWTRLESQARITYSVGGPAPLPVTLLPTAISGDNFGLSFISQSGVTHFVEWTTNLVDGPWLPATNFSGDGTTNIIALPTTNPAAYYRVETQ